jgi:cohesin loading factor subunit SCC2
LDKKYLLDRNEDQICTTHTDFDKKSLLGDFEEFLSGLSQNLNLCENQDFSTKIEEESQILTKYELAKLTSILDKLDYMGSLQALPMDGLSRLLNVLMSTAQRMEGKFIHEKDSEHSTNFIEITTGIEASIIFLRLLTSRNMPRILYVEDNILRIAELLRAQLINNVMVWSETNGKNIRKKNCDLLVENRKMNSSYCQNSHIFEDSFRKNSLCELRNIRGVSTQRFASIVLSIAVNLGLAIEQISFLTSILKLPDSNIHTLLTCFFLPMSIPELTDMHINCVNAIANIFKIYPEHRYSIIDTVVGLLKKIPANGRSVRNFILPYEEEIKIQSMSALIMQCLQSVAIVVPYSNSSISQDRTQNGECGFSFSWASYFWKEILKSWPSSKTSEVEIKSLIQNFVSDLLLCLNIPEWPCASVIILSLCAQLLVSSGIQSNEAKLREFAIDVIGQITTKLKSDELKSRKDSTWELGHLSTPEKMSSSEILPKINKGQNSVCQKALILGCDDVLAALKSGNLEDIYGKFFNNFLLEAILLRYLSENSKPSSRTSSLLIRLREDFAYDAISFHIIQFMRVHKRRKCSNISTASLYHIYSKISEIQNDRRSSPKEDLIEREVAKSLVRHLNQEHTLSQQVGTLIRRLLGMLDDSSISVRASGVRAIGSLLHVDPNIIDFPLLKTALKERVTDAGTMVRATTLDVMGQIISANSSLALEYYQVILDRLNDVGVSVRKRAITIVRDLVKNSDMFNRTDALKKLAFKILDEDDGVQQLVMKLFLEIWFTPLLQKKYFLNFDSRETCTVEAASNCVNLFVTVLWEVYYITNKNGSATLPLTPSFPIILILRKILNLSEEEPVNSDYSPKDLKNVFRCILYGLVDGMIKTEEIESISNRKHVSDKGRINTSARYALGIHAISVVDPHLCIPVDDPTHIIMALQPYLKRNNEIEDVGKLRCCICIIDTIIMNNKHLSSILFKELENDLRILILRSKFQGVLFLATKCLCTIARNRENNNNGISVIVRKLWCLLDTKKDKMILDREEVAHLSRALFVLGSILKHGADIIEEANMNASNDACKIVSIERIFETFLSYLYRHSLEIEVRKASLKACGHLFCSRADYMCNTSGTNNWPLDLILHETLHEASDSQLKLQSLQNLNDFFRKDENFGVIDDNKINSSVQAVNGEADTSNISSAIAQRCWSQVLGLCMSCDAQVRFKSLQLCEVILRQGLVHPMNAFPILIMLQIEVEPVIKKFAFQVLKYQQRRYHEFFIHQLPVGFENAFIYFERIAFKVHKCQVNLKLLPEQIQNGFMKLYNLVGTNRKDKFKFLTCLLQQIFISKENSVLLSLKFFSLVLVKIPYQTADEILFIIYEINRFMSSTCGSLRDSVKNMICPPRESVQLKSPRLHNKECKNKSEACCAVNYLVMLKRYLKKKYGIEDVRIHKFNPKEAGKTYEILSIDRETEEFEHPDCAELVNFESEETLRKIANEFEQLLRDDDDISCSDA